LIIQTRCPKSGDLPPPLAGKPCCCSHHELTDAIPLTGEEPLSFADLKDKGVLAFAGIAEPRLFFEDLRRKGLNLVETIAFPDHADYTEQHLGTIMSSMKSSGAQYCITTEKDGVKLVKAPPELTRRTLLARLALVLDNPETLEKVLLNLLQKKREVR